MFSVNTITQLGSLPDIISNTYFMRQFVTFSGNDCCAIKLYYIINEQLHNYVEKFAIRLVI